MPSPIVARSVSASGGESSALRETSVVIAVAAGARVLHERVDRRRAVGAVVVVAGVAALALA